MSQRRERFIISQVGIMLGAILIMTFVDELGFAFWYVVSYLGFVGLTVLLSMLSLPTKSRTHLLLLLGLGGVGFIAISARTTLRLL